MTTHKPSTIRSTKKNPSKSIVYPKYKKVYAEHRDTCGDKMGIALKDATTTENAHGRECLDLKKLAGVAKANGLSLRPYSKLNNGQKRMVIGNKLRGLTEAGKVVVINDKRFAGANKAA